MYYIDLNSLSVLVYIDKPPSLIIETYYHKLAL